VIELQSRLLEDHELAEDRPNKAGTVSIIKLANTESLSTLIDNKDFINQVQNVLLEKGSVLLRELPISDTTQAETLLDALGVTFDDNYLGGASPRSRLSDHFFTSTEAPAPYVITFHTEMCYLKQRPGKIFFYCITEPSKFGETPIFDCAAIFESLSAELQQKIETHGVIYQRYFVAKKARFFNVYKTWMDAFQANTRDEAEAACMQQGLEFEWQNNGGLITRARMPGLIVDPVSGRKCISLTLYNGESAPYDMVKFKQRINPVIRLGLSTLVRSQYAKQNVFMKTLWGDGSEISAEETRTMIDAAWTCSSLFKWKKRDLLILDNIRSGHGRLNVVKPRKIAAALGDPYLI